MLEELQDKISQVSYKSNHHVEQNLKKNFVIACFVIEKFARLIFLLSNMLQKNKQSDIFLTNELSESVQLALQNDRNNSKNSYKQIYKCSKPMSTV